MTNTDKIILNLIKLECPVIWEKSWEMRNPDSMFSLLYKNYYFEFRNGYRDDLVWINGHTFNISDEVRNKVIKYVTVDVNIEELYKKTVKDIRKQKIISINNLNK